MAEFANTTELRSWIDGIFPEIMRQMGIGHWRVITKYCRIPDDCEGDWEPKMQVSVMHEYDQAMITIDLEACLHETRDSVERMLRHECCHILLGPMHLVKRTLWTMLSPDQREVLRDLWSQAEEMTVGSLERMVRAQLDLHTPCTDEVKC